MHLIFVLGGQQHKTLDRQTPFGDGCCTQGVTLQELNSLRRGHGCILHISDTMAYHLSSYLITVLQCGSVEPITHTYTTFTQQGHPHTDPAGVYLDMTR